MSSNLRMEDLAPAAIAQARRIEEGMAVGGKRKTMLLQEGDVVLGGEGSAALRKMETPAPKARRKKVETTAEDGGEARRRRKPKPTVEVNSTFTELRRLLQEMRPSTLQVLRTPYFRNCKAARNMRKGVRQIRDFCKQVRLETVMLAKKKHGEEMSTRRKRKPDATIVVDPSKMGPDLEPGSPSHSTDVPSHSNEKRFGAAVREPSESSELPKSKPLAPKLEVSPGHKERERSPKRERERVKSPKREREREKSPKRERGRDKSPRREKDREREKSPRREKDRERERERERSPRREREREKSPRWDLERELSREKSPKIEREREREISPKPIHKKPKLEVDNSG